LLNSTLLHHLALHLLSLRHCYQMTSLHAAIVRLPDESSAANSFPVHVLKDVSGILTPFMTHLFYRLLATGCVPASFKNSFVTPILKKTGSNEAGPLSYRQIYNLSIISISGCTSTGYLPQRQLSAALNLIWLPARALYRNCDHPHALGPLRCRRSQ